MRAAALLEAKKPDLGHRPWFLDVNEITYHGSGHLIRYGDRTHPGVLISMKKGGILTLITGEGYAADFGWVVHRGSARYVSHWWSGEWRYAVDDGVHVIHGFMVPAREWESTPLRHGVLRVVSGLLGSRLIGRLKNMLIFKKPDCALPFERRIEINPSFIRIADRISGLEPDDVVLPAPRASARHVASADSYHPEDADLARRCHRHQDATREGAVFKADTLLSAEA